MMRAALGRLQRSQSILGTGDVRPNGISKDELYLSPRDVRCALLRVDSMFPEPALEDHVARAFSGVVSEADKEERHAIAHKDEPLLTLKEVTSRLFAEPIRRFSPRTDPRLLEKLQLKLRAAAKSSGKRTQRDRDAAAMLVTYSELRDALLEVDPRRPESEVDYVAASIAASSSTALDADGEVKAMTATPLNDVLTTLANTLLQLTTERMIMADA